MEIYNNNQTNKSRRDDHTGSTEHKRQITHDERMLVGHEIVTVAGNLRHVGKNANFDGHFPLNPGSAKYREMSSVIVKMGDKVGVSFRRSGKMKSAQLLLGLPDSEYLGFSYTASKHDRRLPSVALVDATQTAANIQYHYEVKIKGRAQLAALTFPVFNQRITVENFKAGVDLAFERWNKLKRSFKNAGLGEVIYAQLEDPYDPKTQTFYLHIHAFIEIGFGEGNQKKVLAFLKSAIDWTDGYGGLKLQVVRKEDVHKALRYGTKPSITAYQIAVAKNSDIFATYLAQSAKKRFTRTEGSLKTTLKELKFQSRRPTFHRCEDTGKQTVKLVEKQKRTGASNSKNDSKIGTDRRRREHTSRFPEQNIYCGCRSTFAAPDNRLRAFGFIQNFEKESFVRSLKMGGPKSFSEANRAARLSWEHNTGQRFDLKEYLRPIAKHLLDLIADQEVHNYTVIVSPTVLEALRAIEHERKSPSSNSKRSISSVFRRKFYIKMNSIFARFWPKRY